MAQTDRPRGIKVRTLDAEALKALTGASPVYSLAYAEQGGTSYLLCSEGVGWVISESEPAEFDAWFPGMSQGLCRLPFATVRALATDEIDLADFIRVFGSRLESNFYGWHRRLTDTDERSVCPRCGNRIGVRMTDSGVTMATHRKSKRTGDICR